MKAEGVHFSHVSGIHHDFNKITRSREYYLLTGDVIILCESVLFKVHKRAVVNKSPLLGRLLVENYGQDPPLLYAGYPVIQVPESAQKFKLLFKVIYDPAFSTVFFHTVEGTPLLDFMRMAYKYGFEDIFHLCRRRLGHFYPDNLDDWDGVQGLRPDPCLVILLCRDLHQPIFLPAAFYQLITTPFLTRAFNSLSSDDIAFYFSLQTKLTQAWRTFIMCENEVSSTCLELSCRDGWAQFRQTNKMQVIAPRTEFVKDPLSKLIYYIRDVVGCEGLCKHEMSMAITRAAFQRMVMWLRLPGLLGDISWEVLKKVDTDSMIAKFQQEPLYPVPNVWVVTPNGNKTRVG